ncbi:hypothetical protein V6N13_025938 [Hibiscus sabdariffa]
MMKEDDERALPPVPGLQGTMRELVVTNLGEREQSQEVDLGAKSPDSLKPLENSYFELGCTEIVSNQQVVAHQDNSAVEIVLSKGLSRKVRSVNDLVIDTLSAEQRNRLLKAQGKDKRALLASLAFLSGIFIRRRGKQLKFPPGPKPWPIIGNLNLIGSLPHQSLHKLSQRYGQLMHLKFGSYPVLVASSAEMAKEFLKSHDQIFATRPPHAAGKYVTYNYSDMLWAPYGPHWRQGRKICQNEIFSSKRLESLEYILVQEMSAFVSRLYGLSGKPVVLKEHLSSLSLSVMCRMVLGKNHFSVSGNDQLGSNSILSLQEMLEILDEFFFLIGVFNVGDWIPWLNFLDLQGNIKRMKALKKKLDRFHDHVFDEHKRKKKGLGKDFVAQDMVDILLQLADDPDLDVKLTYDALRGLTLMSKIEEGVKEKVAGEESTASSSESMEGTTR